MTDHPYWAYKAVPGSLNEEQETEALDEGRRAFALELATRRSGGLKYQLARAVEFEAYLRGDQPVVGVEATEYTTLVERSNKLLRLEGAGVDNWEGYSE